MLKNSFKESLQPIASLIDSFQTTLFPLEDMMEVHLLMLKSAGLVHPHPTAKYLICRQQFLVIQQSKLPQASFPVEVGPTVVIQADATG